MVAGAFLDRIGEGITQIFNSLGNNNGGRSGGDGGNFLGDAITSILDPDKDSTGQAGNGIQNIIKGWLTPQNINTVKDMLRNYWGDHKNEESEVRKNMDMLRNSLGSDSMSQKLAKTIQCIEDEIPDEKCGVDLSSDSNDDDYHPALGSNDYDKDWGLPNSDENYGVGVRSALDSTEGLSSAEAESVTDQVASFAVNLQVGKLIYQICNLSLSLFK